MPNMISIQLRRLAAGLALGLAVTGPLGSVQGQHKVVVDFVKDGRRQAAGGCQHADAWHVRRH